MGYFIIRRGNYMHVHVSCSLSLFHLIFDYFYFLAILKISMQMDVQFVE